MYLTLSAALSPGICFTSNRDEYQREIKKKIQGSGTPPLLEADILTAICEPIVWTV
jgi:hypothetical protein